MKNCLGILVFILSIGIGQSSAQVLENAERAFQLSKESQKPVLLVFSGSDWCAPCIRFNKNVLSQDIFQHYASDHLILLKADFPQRKKLTSEMISQNEQLAEKYNPTGQFPHIVMLDSDQRLIKTFYFKNQNAEAFIDELSRQFAE